MTAIYDPVPGDASSALYGGDHPSPHELERCVQRALLATPGVEFASLQVCRLQDGGVCLTGTVRMTSAAKPLLDRIAARAAGAARIVNRLTIQTVELPAV